MPVIGQYVSRVAPPGGRETVPAGAGLISAAAAPAEAVTGMGRALTDFGASVLNQISQAEDAMELATLRGKGGEIRNAAFDTITKTQDSTIREQIFNKGWQDYNALTSKRPNVQRVFEAEKKLTFVDWQADFNTIDNRLRVQNVRDQFRLNYDRLLEQGNLTGALQLLNTAKGTMAITPAEFDFYKSNMQADSDIARSRILLGNNDPQAAITLLQGLKGLSGEQLDRRDNLLRLAQQTQTGMSDTFGKSILKEMFDADKKPLTPLQRSELAEDMKSRVLDPGNGLSIAESRTLMSDIDKWEKGQFETEPQSYIAIKEALQDLALGTKTKKDVLDLIESNKKTLSISDRKSFTDDVFAEPEKEDSFWEKEAYKTIEKRILSADPLRPGFFFGTPDQIDRSDIAKIRFDSAIKSAAKAGKPLKGTDYLKKAVEISNQLMPKEKLVIFGGQAKMAISEFAEEFEIKEEKRLESYVWSVDTIPSEPPIGMESIWNELSDEEKLTVMKLLFSGKYTVEELVEHSKKKK